MNVVFQKEKEKAHRFITFPEFSGVFLASENQRVESFMPQIKNIWPSHVRKARPKWAKARQKGLPP